MEHLGSNQVLVLVLMEVAVLPVVTPPPSNQWLWNTLVKESLSPDGYSQDVCMPLQHHYGAQFATGLVLRPNMGLTNHHAVLVHMTITYSGTGGMEIAR